MKKLILFTSAMMLAGGVFAECADPEIDLNCSVVYDVKFNLKTPVGKNVSGECADVCYRAWGKKDLKGYLYACDCTCSGFLSAGLYMYDKNDDNEYYSTLGWLVFNRIGKKNTDAEGLFIYSANSGGSSNSFIFVQAGGSGKFDKESDRLISMSGSLSGYMSPTVCDNACSDADYAISYPFCSLDAARYTLASCYGTWSLKYNKKLSNKYAAGLWAPPSVD